MKNKTTRLCLPFLTVLLLISLAGSFACAGPSATAEKPAVGVNQSESAKTETTGPQSTNPTPPPTPASSSTAVSVVVAGYYNHGPMQATTQAIKQVTAKYGDKVTVTWIDLATKEGEDYFQKNGLTAHMNVIINGKYQYHVNGRDVTFQWFEGKQWSKQDLDIVLSSLVGE
jgi:hypothetical protein